VVERAQTPPEFQHVFRWDLDKTYLRTDFDSVLDLLKTAVETPERKRTVPGAAALMRELRASGKVQVCIVSGSPEQMRSVLEKKLRLDGVEWDEFVLKPTLSHVMKLRFRAVREQVGYKLPALLRARARLQGSPGETLFGDDAEADALVYSLYADILGGLIGEHTLRAVVEKAGAYPDAVENVLRATRGLAHTNPVKRIFIHLDRRSDPAFFVRYGPRVVPVYNYFQSALVLVGDGVLSPEAAVRQSAALTIEHDFDVRDLLSSAIDVASRGHLTGDTLERVAEACTTVRGPFPVSARARAELAEGLRAASVRVGAPVPAVSVDYLAALAEDRARWESAKLRARRDARGG
jgi:hypothetical protein